MFKKNLGVDVKIEGKEWKSYIDMYKQSDFQLLIWDGEVSTLDPAAQLEFMQVMDQITMQNGIIKTLII